MTPTIVTPAHIEWRKDKLGNTVPFSLDFDDIYYSTANGLAESRYVFVDNNQLPERFINLFECAARGSLAQDRQTFTIAELGFGTGLNLLVTWQLWQEVKHKVLAQLHPSLSPMPRLHFISTEKHPLAHADFARSLECWQNYHPSIGVLINKLINNYPTLVAGVHRIHLADDVILDLWLGEAVESLASLDTSFGACVNAWYLDGFAPTCNESMWAQQIFKQMRRLSTLNTTVATFSCAGVVKRSLSNVGFNINKVKGFGHKREMLTAVMPEVDQTNRDHPKPTRMHKVAVIGAGVAGLMSAWSLATRGIHVLLIDKIAPLAGASGNPRALLAPKMTPIHHVAEHLHSIGYLYGTRFYQCLDRQNSDNLNNKSNHHCAPQPIFEPTGTLDLLLKANVDVTQIADYPDTMATTLSHEAVADLMGLGSPLQSPHNLNETDNITAFCDNLYLPQAGLINPRVLADTILKHPLINFVKHHVKRIDTQATSHTDNNPVHSDNSHHVTLLLDEDAQDEIRCDPKLNVDAAIIACAYNSHQLDARVFDFRKIRGQLSWLTLHTSSDSTTDNAKFPKVPLKYGGYCATFTPIMGDERLNPVSVNQPSFLLGASFVRNDLSTDIRDSEHDINRNKLVDAIPQFDMLLPKQTNDWQARVGIRAQTPDYHPLVGQVDDAGYIWTLSGMGSKGYAFAPICAEALVDMMTGQFAPISSAMIAKLSPKRTRLRQVLT